MAVPVLVPRLVRALGFATLAALASLFVFALVEHIGQEVRLVSDPAPFYTTGHLVWLPVVTGSLVLVADLARPCELRRRIVPFVVHGVAWGALAGYLAWEAFGVLPQASGAQRDLAVTVAAVGGVLASLGFAWERIRPGPSPGFSADATTDPRNNGPGASDPGGAPAAGAGSDPASKTPAEQARNAPAERAARTAKPRSSKAAKKRAAKRAR